MSIPEYADQYLLAPLGTKFSTWISTPGGSIDTGGDMEMRPPRHGQVGFVGAVKLNRVVVITGGNYYNGEGYPFQLMERFILPAVLEYSG